MTHKTEAHIVINDVPLTFVQSMTVRVAMSNLALDLQENGLGEDEHGIFMTNSYLKSIREINAIIFKNLI